MSTLEKSSPRVPKGEVDEIASIPQRSSPSKASTKSSASLAESATSTLTYQQTLFDEFKPLVKELCLSLWPATGKELRPAGPSGRLLDVFKGKKFRKPQPIHAPEDFQIERLEGGSFNRITGLVAPTFENASRLILRTPRTEWSATPERDIAILSYVGQYTPIPVPKIVKFDLSANNALKQSYVIQTRISGYSLQRVYPNLNHEQNCQVAKEVGQIILALQNVNSSMPDVVDFDSKDSSKNSLIVRPFDIRLRADTQWRLKPQDHEEWSQESHKRFHSTTRDFLVTQFGRWRADELRRDPSGIAWWDYQHRLVNVAEEMGRLGVLDDENCLAHLDLAARNIMVDVPIDQPLKVSGVLDWDSAVFAPKFVSCAPPWWVWADDPEDDGADWDEQDETRALKTPPTPHGRELKSIFEETVGEDYLHYAYEPQYRMARKLFQFAVNGVQQNEDVAEANKLIDEWKDFYKNMIQRAMDEMPKASEEFHLSDGLSETHRLPDSADSEIDLSKE